MTARVRFALLLLLTLATWCALAFEVGRASAQTLGPAGRWQHRRPVCIGVRYVPRVHLPETCYGMIEQPRWL